MKIGLTGSIACGKSTVSAYLASLGCAIVDADAISRALTADGGAALPAVRQAFGDSVFRGNPSTAAHSDSSSFPIPKSAMS